jgi:hypothetical protein
MMEAALALLRRFWPAIPILLLALALFATRSTLAGVRAWQETTVAATREAAANPKLKVRDVPAQIAALGRSVGALDAGLARCNASARAAAETDRQAQIRAQEALRQAQARDAGRQVVIDRLRSSAAQARAPAAACEPSETVKEIWK